MLFKIIVILLFLTILFSLSSGLVFMIKDKGHTKRTVKALTFRIGLSVFAFLLLMAAIVGPRVLRTETAPIVALSIIQYLAGDLSV